MRILVADDEAKVAAALKDHLESMGHSVAVVSGGRGAIELLGQESFDCAYIDVMMPYVNGYEVVDWIRKESGQPNMWVAIMTAQCEHMDEEKLEKWRIDDCIQKPIDLDKLVVKTGQS